MDRDIVVGSGPAGAAAAHALVAQGRRVTILDVGELIEPERIALRDRLGAAEPDTWDEADVEMARAPSLLGEGEGIRPFGSDILFRDPVGFKESSESSAPIGYKPSFARGGMSNGWGAAVLPYRSADLEAWPIAEADLAPHYEAVRAFVPIAARRDDLADLFPVLDVREDTSLPSSSQGLRLLERFDRARGRLQEMGVYYGKARQGVRSGCRTCGMCLYGCPYRLIYNASDVIERLCESGRVEYRRGEYVLRFQEDATGVRVWSRRVPGGGIMEHRGARVFVGAGILSTARIVLNSLGKVGARVLLNDSQHFFLPMLHRWWPRPDPAKEARHVLTQVFVEILDPTVSGNLVHVQLYTHNDSFAVDMRARFGPFAGLMAPAIAHLSRRLIVGQGFLHSDDSGRIEIRLTAGGQEPRLRFEPLPNPETGPAVERVVRRLGATARLVGLVALSPLRRLNPIGSSYHCGGTFPMRERPREMETDALGRLSGLRRVFLVDSSVFPSVPASTISLSIMANAHRIATEAGRS